MTDRKARSNLAEELHGEVAHRLALSQVLVLHRSVNAVMTASRVVSCVCRCPRSEVRRCQRGSCVFLYCDDGQRVASWGHRR